MSDIELDSEVTFWTITGNDGTGGKTYANGIKVDARLADIDDNRTFSVNGKDVRAVKAVYTDVKIPVGAYVVEGDQAGLSAPTAGAQQVIKHSANIGMTTLNRALLT